jgi:hypothetical protein
MPATFQASYSFDFKSFFHAVLDLSDTFLNKLGVGRENVDDTAGAAQVIHL